jgi:tetratricopeptide (TPR) repeat protein
MAVGLALVGETQAGMPFPSELFNVGVEAYAAGDYAEAASAFRDCVQVRPSSGTLLNLGNAEWQGGRAGEAILAWERALWIDPFNQSARNNLRFARDTAQLESPELTWYEVASTWLPANWWAWIAGGSLWFAVALLVLPGILRRRKAPWHQAVAAVGFGVLLLSLPAHVGTLTRTRLGFVLEKDVLLRLTPTSEAEAVTRLASGEPGRLVQARGDYVLLQTSRSTGWIRRKEFGLLTGR